MKNETNKFSKNDIREEGVYRNETEGITIDGIEDGAVSFHYLFQTREDSQNWWAEQLKMDPKESIIRWEEREITLSTVEFVDFLNSKKGYELRGNVLETIDEPFR